MCLSSSARYIGCIVPIDGTHQVYKRRDVSMESVAKTVSTTGVVSYQIKQDDIILTLSTSNINEITVTQGDTITRYPIGGGGYLDVPQNIFMAVNTLMSARLYDVIFNDTEEEK